jgi:predicted nucleic acid-binding protein
VAADRYLLDSNILIRWVQHEDPGAAVVEAALDELMIRNAELFYTSQNLGEFWNAMTRPANRNRYGLTPAEADKAALEFETAFDILPDSPAVHAEWRRLLVKHNVSGVQVHDARIAAAMHVHTVKSILTFNTKDFARFADIEAVHPADLARSRVGE